MQKIGIETTQNVVLHQEVASIGDIMVAHIIDVVIKWAYILLLGVALGDNWGFGDDGQLVYTVLSWAPFAFYHLASELLMNGQTVGKRVMKIKVARMDGTEPGLGQYLLRWLFRIVDVWLYAVGLAVILFNGKGQRLGDIVAGTTVVTLKTRVRLEETLMAHVPEGHQVRFPEVIRLNDAQAVLIREVLNAQKGAAQWTIYEEMAAKVRNAIGGSGADLNAKEFLETVLRDYVHITGQGGR